MNLLSNAIKFTPYGGKIKISCKLVKSDNEFSVSDPLFSDVMHKSGINTTYLEVQVEDNGMGIQDEDKQKLFQLFGCLESNKSINSKGIGLGLFIAKKITKTFGGNIICRSQYG